MSVTYDAFNIFISHDGYWKIHIWQILKLILLIMGSHYHKTDLVFSTELK